MPYLRWRIRLYIIHIHVYMYKFIFTSACLFSPWIGRTDAEAEVSILWPPDVKSELIGKTLMLGKIEGRRRRGWEDEIVGWHHRLSGHESEQTPGDSEGQGSLACCSPWGHKESDMTARQNNMFIVMSLALIQSHGIFDYQLWNMET